MSRKRLALRVCDYVGDDQIEVVDAGNGWPTRVVTKTHLGPLPCALHCSKVGSHSRRDYELRFQNPSGRVPVEVQGREFPLLIGLDESVSKRPIIVVADGRSRVGRKARFSILFQQRLVTEARSSGWAVYVSQTEERIYGIQPRLLPILVGCIASDVIPDVVDVQSLIDAAGLLGGTATSEQRERTRRITEQIVRRSAFSRDILRAYKGRCAVCLLDIPVIAGAHIYPVSAADSSDEITNGLALCENHHRLFDRHLLYIDPDTFAISVHPEILEHAERSERTARFVRSVLPELEVPSDSGLRPSSDNFRLRYDYYENKYHWISSS